MSSCILFAIIDQYNYESEKGAAWVIDYDYVFFVCLEVFDYKVSNFLVCFTLAELGQFLHIELDSLFHFI